MEDVDKLLGVLVLVLSALTVGLLEDRVLAETAVVAVARAAGALAAAFTADVTVAVLLLAPTVNTLAAATVLSLVTAAVAAV